MGETNNVTIYGYGDNNPSGVRDKSGHVKEPLVHILGHNAYGEQASFSFPPTLAAYFCELVMKAAKAAELGVEEYSNEFSWSPPTTEEE